MPTFTEIVELTDFNNSPELKEIIQNEYTQLEPSTEVSEDTMCTIYAKASTTAKFSISFHPDGGTFPQDFSYMLWLGEGDRLWMQVHSPVSPTTSSVYTHTIPQGSNTSTTLKSWVVGISHNSSDAIQIRVCQYGWNDELITTLPADANTITELEFNHPIPFGTALDPTTRYITDTWCNAKIRAEITKVAAPASATAAISYWLDYGASNPVGRIFSDTFVGNSSPAGTYSTYVEAYPILDPSIVNGTTVLEGTLFRSNVNNISSGVAQILSTTFTGSLATTFNGAYLSTPDVDLSSSCTFSE